MRLECNVDVEVEVERRDITVKIVKRARNTDTHQAEYRYVLSFLWDVSDYDDPLIAHFFLESRVFKDRKNSIQF